MYKLLNSLAYDTSTQQPLQPTSSDYVLGEPATPPPQPTYVLPLSSGGTEQPTAPTTLPLAQDPEKSTQYNPESVDPGNSLFDSFTGVTRLPTGAITLGQYLAKGAFGKVYQGQWGSRPVALKQINFHYATKAYSELNLEPEELKEALSWEISRLSTVIHPNLVTFYGIYQPKKEDYTYLVMEFCKGGELRAKLDQDPHIPWSKKWQWALELSEGLSYLHHQGILHRDLKAENVLLDRHDRAKLADLGVAQVDALLQEEEASVVAQGLQDKRFIAPENIKDPRLSTQATDIYALGLVFWEIASGKAPRSLHEFSSYEIQEWAAGKKVEREPIPECPQPFQELILTCWHPEPEKRPSAEALVNTLHQIGPELNTHAQFIQNCQQLEKLMHPKRKEGLSYSPPFVTEHAVDEPIDTYWGRFEHLQPDKAPKNPPHHLEDTFQAFITPPGPHTLLLLGEAGLGKSLTTYLWGDRFLQSWWAHLQDPKTVQIPAFFPLFIRSYLKQWTHKALHGACIAAVESYNLPSHLPLLVFADGYDELQMDEKPTNLPSHLGLTHLPHPAKLIVTCRPNTVDRFELKERFNFQGQLTTRHFLPFKMDQLLTYLKTALSWEDKCIMNTNKSYKNPNPSGPC